MEKLPPAFCTITETAADLANRHLQNALYHPAQHSLDLAAAKIDSPLQNQVKPSQPQANPAKPNPSQPNANPTQPTTSQSNANVQPSNSSTTMPSLRDPSLPSVATNLQYIDVFVDNVSLSAKAPTTAAESSPHCCMPLIQSSGPTTFMLMNFFVSQSP